MVIKSSNKGRVDISTDKFKRSIQKHDQRNKIKNKKEKPRKWSEVNHDGMTERGYIVDKSLSSKDFTTYYNPKTKKASIRYRETDPTNWRDLTTDALIAVGLQGLGSRFKRAEKVYDKAALKYGGKENVNVYGHSLGGSQALHVNQTRGAKAWAYNPGAGPLEPVKHAYNKVAASLGNEKAKRRIKNQKDKAKVVRNITDPVSVFSRWGGAYDTTNQYNGLLAHGQSTLGR